MGKRSRKRRKAKETPIPVQEEPAIEPKVPEFSPPPPTNSWTATLMQWAVILGAILIAWGLGAWLRLDWVSHAEKQPAFQWQGHYLPTTHDSYYYTSIIHQASNTNAVPAKLKGHPGPMENGAITLLGTALVRYGGFHVADVITYLPVFMAGLLAVPMVLLGRLYGSTIAGCCSACLAVVAFSYFNRTNAGYFDTDMFSVTVPALILYFLLRANKDESLLFLVLGAVGIYIYPFFYRGGVPIVTALGISFIGYRMLVWLAGFLVKKEHPPTESMNFTLGAIPLICLAIIYCSTTTGVNWENNPGKPLIGLTLLFASAIGLALILTNILTVRFQVTIHPSHPRYALIPIAAVCLMWMVGFSNSFDRIRNATLDYLPSIKASPNAGNPQGEAQQNPIIYKNVKETIIEARKSPWSELMERISGSSWGCMFALFGYLLLVILYPELLIAIPFIGIGVFAHWGGHRFTIHAVPIAAMSAIFLPLCLLELVRRFKKWSKDKAPADCSWPKKPKEYFSQFGNWIFAVGGVRMVMPILALALIWPNIQIAKERSAALPTVLQQAEVQLLDDLRKASKPGDYVHTWWDWGTAVWCHTERNVLTHPGSQSFDTFICAKMLMTDSPRLAAHLGRTAAEYFHHGGSDGSSGLAVDHIFGKGKQAPPDILKSVEEHLPVQPTRDVFMYLPYRLLNFYLVLHMFSERNLTTGKENPFPRFTTFPAWQRQGNAIKIYGRGQIGQPDFLLDLAQLTLTDMRRGIPPMQARAAWQSGRNPFPKVGVITLYLKNKQLLHGNRIQTKPDGFDLTFLNGKTGFVPQGEVQMIYPTGLVKQVEQPNSHESHVLKGDPANKLGLHIICSRNPPIAVLADEVAYKSQLVQMLVLGRADPEYFEPISANGAGRVFKLKK
jgi:dolichyl-diphosphooligosaccharide--protein glycosyltransferase/undecaprenyl-diphosphooligosaccharide--protein glycosyltransferase